MPDRILHRRRVRGFHIAEKIAARSTFIKLGVIRTDLTRSLAVLLTAATLCFANSLRGAAASSFLVSEQAEGGAVDEATPAAACNGKNCLIVWKDNRLAPEPFHRGQYLLYGRRFDLAGQALDDTSFPIQDESFAWNNEGLTLPAIGALGRDYLVVWLTRFRQVEGRRVLGDGTVKTNRIEIAHTGTASGQPAVASTRRGFLVAWTDRINNNGDIYATLLDRNGQVTRVVPVATDSANAQYLVAASVGQNYLILWRELALPGEDIIKAALVTPTGEVHRLDDFPAWPANWVAVAGNGRNYFITWQTASSDYAANQFNSCMLNCRGRMTRNETALATCGGQSLPAVLPTGRSFTVLWRENPYNADAMLYALPVSARGIAETSPSPMNCNTSWSGYGTSTALGRSSALVVLEQRTPDYYDNGYISRVSGAVVGTTP